MSVSRSCLATVGADPGEDRADWLVEIEQKMPRALMI